MVKKKQKTEKKEPGIFKRILKWIGLTLLAVLIILALIFQAPWKVTILLLIILAACTVLPKLYRKWFWLSAAAIVIALIIWVFLPEDNEGWRPYTFDEELAALEAKYAVPDDENAAVIYNKLLDNYDEDAFYLENYDEDAFYANLPDEERYELPMREPWLRRDHPELAEWLRNKESTIATLIEAYKIEKCRFPIYADPVYSSRLNKRLIAMRQWAFLLTTAANNDFGQSRTEEALEKMITVLQMGKHHCQQATMVDILAGIAIEALAIRQFKSFIVDGDASEEHLSVIEKPLIYIKHNWHSDWPRILESGKLLAKNWLARMFYQKNQKGKIRLSRDPYAEWRASLKEHLEAGRIENEQVLDLYKSRVYLTFLQKKIIRAKTILNWFFIPSTPQKAAKIVDVIYEGYYPMSDTAFDWKKEREETSTRFNLNYPHPFEPLVGMLEQPLYRFHDMYFRSIAEQRGTLLIIAFRRYKNENGRWPDKLDDIKSLAPAEIFVDPANGGSFVYKLTDENFKLYSKGKNNIDEGGQREPESGADDWPIWPRKGRKNRVKNDSTL